MAIIDQLGDSRVSLVGNGFNPRPNQPSWGYQSPNGNNTLDPALSELQYTYSVDGNPNERIVDFNRAALGGVTAVKPPAMLDELDPNAPNNYQAQVYKSTSGRNYRDLGPADGRY
jgi:hypothetical protein